MIIVPSPCRPKLNLARSSSSRRLVAIVMIEVVNGTITIPNWEKHQSIDAVERYKEQARERALNYRQRQKAIAAENSSVTQSNVTRNVTRNVTHNVTRNVTVTQNHAIEEDIDKDIEEDIKEIDKEKPTRHKYGEYQNVLLIDLHNRNLAQKTSFAVCQ